MRATVAASPDQLEATSVNAKWSKYIRSLMSRFVDAEGRLFTADEIWHLD